MELRHSILVFLDSTSFNSKTAFDTIWQNVKGDCIYLMKSKCISSTWIDAGSTLAFTFVNCNIFFASP